MAGRKITDLPDFVGQGLLLAAQARGLEVTQSLVSDAVGIMLIGLASLLVERNISDLAALDRSFRAALSDGRKGT